MAVVCLLTSNVVDAMEEGQRFSPRLAQHGVGRGASAVLPAWMTSDTSDDTGTGGNLCANYFVIDNRGWRIVSLGLNVRGIL